MSEQTAGKIPALLTGDTPSSDTRLVLVNAVYFLATWRHPFAPTATKLRGPELPLPLTKSRTSTVPSGVPFVRHSSAPCVPLSAEK